MEHSERLSQEQGFADINTPRIVIKKAFEVNLIKDGRLWLKLLVDRNLTSHAYDEETADEVEKLSVKSTLVYFPIISNLKTKVT